MGYNPRKYSPEVVKRHIAILELRGRDMGRTDIARELNIKFDTVNNTIHNHEGKLNELRQLLAVLESAGERDTDTYKDDRTIEPEVRDVLFEDRAELRRTILDMYHKEGLSYRVVAGRLGTGVTLNSVAGVVRDYYEDYLVGIGQKREDRAYHPIERSVRNKTNKELRTRTDAEQVAIYHTLLELIFEEGFSPQTVRSEKFQAKLGFLSEEELDSYLSGLANVRVPFVSKSEVNNGITTYQVTEEGEPFALYERFLAVEDWGIYKEEQDENDDGVSDIEENSTPPGQIDDVEEVAVTQAPIEELPLLVIEERELLEVVGWIKDSGKARITEWNKEGMEMDLNISSRDASDRLEKLKELGLFTADDGKEFTLTKTGKSYLSTFTGQASVEHRDEIKDAAE